MLARTAVYALLGQLLVIVVVAAAVPGGSSWLVLSGFATAYYDRNLFAVRIAALPWTDPAVYVSIQTTVQMSMVALVIAGASTLVRTNPWQHGVLPDSSPPRRGKPSPADTHAAGPAPAPGLPPAAGPGQACREVTHHDHRPCIARVGATGTGHPTTPQRVA